MRALVVVDYQNDFVTGVLGSRDAESIGERIHARISEHLRGGDLVIFTRDTHEKIILIPGREGFSPSRTASAALADGSSIPPSQILLEIPAAASWRRGPSDARDSWMF